MSKPFIEIRRDLNRTMLNIEDGEGRILISINLDASLYRMGPQGQKALTKLRELCIRDDGYPAKWVLE